MDVISLGYQTDLALLQLGGSRIADRGDHLVVRSPHNPTHWWGNFMLVSYVPPAADVNRWLEAFASEFPKAGHVALGFDGISGSVGDLMGFEAAGLKPEAQTVMTAQSVHEPPRPNREATYREMTNDDDWAQQVALRLACNDTLEPVAYRDFASQRAATARTLVEAGHGAWFGAFLDGQLASAMGLFAAGPGLARFQSVETHPQARGRGLAGTLVHYVSRYGLDRLGAHTLVMVADPDYPAIRIYRCVGFTDTETQLQVERPPSNTL
ncbi:MAG: GNAT family N-acetyltransferase [Nocardioidaceae bacterium]